MVERQSTQSGWADPDEQSLDVQAVAPSRPPVGSCARVGAARVDARLTPSDQRHRRRARLASLQHDRRAGRTAAGRRASRAKGAWLTVVRDGREVRVLDAMASWWTAVHGHGHPALDAALTRQLSVMNHVMFGGLTHEPAARLAQLLVEITPAGLDTVFFSDSGSVSVEVAVKMALQYQRSRGRPAKHRLMTWRGGYHGDTFTPMSVCDPDGGMHSLWTGRAGPAGVRARRCPPTTTRPTARRSRRSWPRHADELAAVIVEPVVQGAGGMRFHDPRYLTDLRAICDRHDVLLIFDEIATGFGRTGELFAADHAGVSPDIMCVGKALTGGYVTLAATLCTAGDRARHQQLGGRCADARPDVHGQRAGLRGVGGQRRGAARPGLADPGRRDQRRPARRAGAGAGAAGCRRRPGARGDRRHRDGATRRSGGRHHGGAGPRRLAASVPQPDLRDAAVHLHARRDRPDHLGHGRRWRVR